VHEFIPNEPPRFDPLRELPELPPAAGDEPPAAVHITESPMTEVFRRALAEQAAR
jgi:hypothetical protein